VKRAIYQESLYRASNKRARELGKMSDAFPARVIGYSTAAGGTRLFKRLGFNTLQGRIVCLENREGNRGGEDVDSGNKS
jgi:hypothetical protein